MNPNKFVIVSDNGSIVVFKKKYTLHKSNTIIHKDHLEICSICSDTQCNLQTYCNHTFCESCIQKWMNSNKNKTCPYCRSRLKNTVFQPITTH